MLFSKLATILTGLWSIHLTSASYIQHRRQSSSGMTAAQIIKVLPDTASCDGTPACRTADQAVTFINQSFQKFNFATAGEQAALFAFMALVSSDFRIDKNPLVPGQGTRGMLTFQFILPYALEFNLAAVQAIRPDLTAQSTFRDVTDPTQVDKILDTVLGDELSFASAAWVLRTQCQPAVAQGLQAANEAGFNAWLGCTGFPTGSGPLSLYQATLATMGH